MQAIVDGSGLRKSYGDDKLRVIFMHQGRVNEMRPPVALFGDPQSPELKQFLSSQRD